MTPTILPKALNQKSLLEAVSHLAGVDEDFAQIVSDFGPPPLWDREPGFSTLVLIILEQQVSLASAKAAFNKLLKFMGPLTPERFLGLTDTELKEIGFSRQKTLYCRELSKAIVAGDLDLSEFERLDDMSARTQLMKIKGIGRWTADIYLLIALLRPDIWPSGDLALAKAVMKLKKLSSIPSYDLLDKIAVQWKPWRAVAARLLWHYYLNGG